MFRALLGSVGNSDPRVKILADPGFPRIYLRVLAGQFLTFGVIRLNLRVLNNLQTHGSKGFSRNHDPEPQKPVATSTRTRGSTFPRVFPRGKWVSMGLMPAAARLLPQLLSINPVETSNTSERSSVYRSRYSDWSSIRNSVIKVYQEEAKATVVSNVGPFVGCPRTGVSREVLPVCQGIGTTQTRPSKAPSTATNSVREKPSGSCPIAFIRGFYDGGQDSGGMGR
ncbi:hypothetical protein C8R47DRAFT_1232750 [Mycena vitilis]|nr:hypothetical protein C8R47DRAFT_1232750 [Mycena vitilis]